MIDWQFEHFKTFTPYDIMQQAAAMLLLYENACTDGSNHQMSELTECLIENTGHPAWMPERSNGNLNVNTEGSVFRNKARLFSSFYICVPPDLLRSEGHEKQIILTDFGRALASGRVSESQFYEYIITHFSYPHVSFSDYDKWKSAGISLRPFICILKTLVGLFEKYGRDSAYLTAEEVYNYLQPLSNEKCDQCVTLIMQSRNQTVANTSSAEKFRKINEMLAFLSIAGYVYIDSSESEDRYRLNLISRHPVEKTFFYLQRSAGGAGTGTSKHKENIIDNLKRLWEK